MNCEEASVLLHALIDGELDAGHAREVEAHIASCPDCAARLREFQEFRNAMTPSSLRYAAPVSLRSRIEGKLPALAAVASRRSIIKGFAVGATASALAASGLLVMVMRTDDDRRVLGEVVSAHLRSLQAEHLTDVVSTDQHTVKPWFNGKLDVAPPVIDLTTQGFTLVGGRLDYINGEAAGSIVYRRRNHVINLFVEPRVGAMRGGGKLETTRGFNVRHWTDEGFDFWAVSDLNTAELEEFCQNFRAALHPQAGSS
jgi:anti-sigma factor RsiW